MTLQVTTECQSYKYFDTCQLPDDPSSKTRYHVCCLQYDPNNQYNMTKCISFYHEHCFAYSTYDQLLYHNKPVKEYFIQQCKCSNCERKRLDTDVSCLWRGLDNISNKSYPNTLRRIPYRIKGGQFIGMTTFNYLKTDADTSLLIKDINQDKLYPFIAIHDEEGVGVTILLGEYNGISILQDIRCNFRYFDPPRHTNESHGFKYSPGQQETLHAIFPILNGNDLTKAEIQVVFKHENKTFRVEQLEANQPMLEWVFDDKCEHAHLIV